MSPAEICTSKLGGFEVVARKKRMPATMKPVSWIGVLRLGDILARVEDNEAISTVPLLCGLHLSDQAFYHDLRNRLNAVLAIFGFGARKAAVFRQLVHGCAASANREEITALAASHNARGYFVVEKHKLFSIYAVLGLGIQNA